MLEHTQKLNKQLKNQAHNLTAESGDKDAPEQKQDPTHSELLASTETQRLTIPIVLLDPQGSGFLSQQGSAPSLSSEIIC